MVIILGGLQGCSFATAAAWVRRGAGRVRPRSPDLRYSRNWGDSIARLNPRNHFVCVAVWCALAVLRGQEPKPKPEASAEAPADVSPKTALEPIGPSADSASTTESAASHRNENVYIVRVDNNALRESLIRVGASITIVNEPGVSANYYGAEFGQAPVEFPFLKAATRGGWHGELYETLQNSIFNARTFFQVGPVKPSRQNQYGFQVGGPVSRKQFLSFEAGQRKLRGMVNGNVLVPRADEREPLTADPAKAALIRRFLGAYGTELPNRLDLDPRALNTNSPQRINDDSISGRWDLDLGGSRKIWTQYQHQNQVIHSFQLIAGQNPDTTLRTRHAQITLSQPFRGSGEWTSGFSLRRLHTILVSEPNAVGPSARFAESIEFLGPRWNVPLNRTENTFRGGSQVAWISGNHKFTAGGEYARLQFNGSESQGHRGTYGFNDNFGRTAMENFLMGVPTYYFQGIGDTSRGFRSRTGQLYFGDQWRATPGLSITAGLRYGMDGAPSEVNHRTTVSYPCDCNNLSPRLGLAYQLGGWGVLRASYTLSYGQIIPATYQQARFNPPAVISIEVDSPNFVNPLQGIDLSHIDANTRSGLLLLSANLHDAYAHQYNFSWERQFQNTWMLRLGYVGSRSKQLFSALQINRAQPVPGIPLTTDTYADRRADQRYNEILKLTNMGDAYLDAAQASVAIPGRHGLAFAGSYTFSKAIDTGSDYTSSGSGDEAYLDASQTEYELKKDLKGPSRFDSRHTFLARLSYDLPTFRNGQWRYLTNGLNISGGALLKSGLPFTLRVGSDSPGFGNVDGMSSDRPNLLNPSILGRAIDNPDTSTEMLPRSAFAYLGSEDRRGNLGRNTFRKDGIHNVNLAITRTWIFPSSRAERRLTFRAEAMNALNHPQFDAPGFTLVNNNFGKITNTLNDGRILQLGLRFYF